jgi:hypothetical protein
MWFIRTRRRDLEVSFFVLIDSKNTALYKFRNQNDAQNDNQIHQLQQDYHVTWIVLGENDRIHDPAYFKIIRQPNGDIYLKLIDIFRHKEEAAGSDYQANPADDSADRSPNYHHHKHE